MEGLLYGRGAVYSSGCRHRPRRGGAYVEYSTTDVGEWVLYGIKPVLIAIVLQALWGLGRTAVKGFTTAVLGGMALGLYLLGVNEIILVFGSGALAAAARGGSRAAASRYASLFMVPVLAPVHAAATVPGYSLLALFLNFLKIGSVLYGSGYVLLAFLRGDFVDRLGWLTDQQLIDAIAIGSSTGAGLYDCDVRRLPGRQLERSRRRYDRHIPALVHICGAVEPHTAMSAGPS